MRNSATRSTAFFHLFREQWSASPNRVPRRTGKAANRGSASFGAALPKWPAALKLLETCIDRPRRQPQAVVVRHGFETPGLGLLRRPRVRWLRASGQLRFVACLLLSDPRGRAAPTINAGQMPSSRKPGCSRLTRPGYRRDSLDEETTDWRAVCEKTPGQSTSEFRREQPLTRNELHRWKSMRA